jgi:predicted RNase H-like HicB family nuclease
MTSYLVVYERGEDGGWGAHLPDVPGCIACGKTQPEVEELMRDALPMHIELLRESGLPVPEPHSYAGTVAA